MVRPDRPLKGIRIGVTRAKRQAPEFISRLRSLGAEVFACPTIRIRPPRSAKPLDEAVAKLDSYDWLIFTSANGVEKFMERFNKVSPLPEKFPKTCAIGPVTARKMKEYGLKVDKVSKNYVAESILDELKFVKGKRILIPRAAKARDVLPRELQKRGASVRVVAAYQTEPDRSQASSLRNRLKAGALDCVTFTSSSTVTNFFSLLGERDKIRLARGGVRAASIGPVTTRTLLDHGWKPAIVAAKPTTWMLVRAIADYYG